MAKNDLVKKSLWDNYSENVSRRMNNPTYRGELTPEDAGRLHGSLVIADWGAESCGDAVRLYWIVDPNSHRILDARFKSFGCGTAIAASDMMAELTIGKSVDDVLNITNLTVEHALRDQENTPSIPPQKMHCSVMAYDVIKKAVAIYKNVEMASLETEQIVCECARVSLATIKDAIQLNDLKTVDEIVNYTKAGAFCGSCRRPGGHERKDIYLIDILNQTREKMANERLNGTTPVTSDFPSLTPVRQLKVMETIISKKIAPVLSRDGGSVEIADIEKGETGTTVYISYEGACKHCSSGKTETLHYIEKTLNEEIGSPIIVKVLDHS